MDWVELYVFGITGRRFSLSTVILFLLSLLVFAFV